LSQPFLKNVKGHVEQCFLQFCEVLELFWLQIECFLGNNAKIWNEIHGIFKNHEIVIMVQVSSQKVFSLNHILLILKFGYTLSTFG
jgi:hypothetical protein